MVLPWPLLARALYFPEPTTTRRLTLPWHLAPSPAGVTIMFTAIEKYSKLKAAEEQVGNSGVLEAACRLLQRVVRSKLEEHEGYEVEGEATNFVLAFGCPAKAVAFATDVQVALVHAPWSNKVLDSTWGCEYRSASGSVLFRGPRLAVGMCTDDAVRAQPSDRTGRMEYFGPIM